MYRMWAWYDKETDSYSHIYRSRSMVEMCSPDGFETRMDRGEGRIVEIEIAEVESPEGGNQ